MLRKILNTVLITIILVGIISAGSNVTLKPMGYVKGTASVSGSTDKSNISINIPGTSLTAYTDANGSFIISSVPIGTWSVTASRPGATPNSVSNLSIAKVGDTADAGTITLSAASTSEQSVYISSIQKYSLSDYSGARTGFSSLTTSTTFGDEANYRIGLSYYQENNWAQAISYFAKVSASSSFISKAKYYTARSHEQQGDLTSAQNEYTTIISSFSGTTAATDASYRLELISYNTAYRAYLNYDYTTAISNFKSFKTSYPSSTLIDKANISLAKAYDAMEDYSNALTTIGLIKNTSDQYNNALYLKARVYDAAESYTESQVVSAYQALLSAYPDSANATNAELYLAGAQWSSGDTAGAVTSYNEYLSTYATSPYDSMSAMYSLGLKYYFSLDYSTALSWFEKASAVDGNSKKAGSVWYFIGRSHEKKAAVPTDPNDADIIVAKSSYNKVISSYPNCSKYSAAQTKLNALP